MRHAVPVAFLFVVAVLLLSACAVDRAGLSVSDLGAVPLDMGGGDGGPRDLGTADLSSVDLAIADLGMPDLNDSMDLGPADLGPRDLGPADLGPRDLGPPDLGPRDLGPPDLGPRDLGPPDLGPRDLGPPDLGPPDLGPPSCNSRYMTAPGYVLCMERPADCVFYTSLGGISCDARCTGLGGTCVGAFANGGTSARCSLGAADTCASTHSDEVCVCSR